MFGPTKTPPSKVSTSSTNPQSDLEMLQAALKRHYQPKQKQRATSSSDNLPLVLLRHDIVKEREKRLGQGRATSVRFTKEGPTVAASKEDYQNWLTLYDDLYSPEGAVALQDLFSKCPQKNKRVLIFGDTGAGKSTIAREFASAWSNNSSSSEGLEDVKLLIPGKYLRTFLLKQKQKISLADVIHQFCLDLRDQKAITPEIIKTFIERHKKECFMVVDGYERIAHLDNKEKSEHIRALFDDILTFPKLIVTAHRKNVFNLATGGYRGRFGDTFDIMGFTRETVFQYIETFYKSLQPPKPELSQKLHEILTENPNLLRMLRTPLILQIFCKEALSLIDTCTPIELTVKAYKRLTNVMIRQDLKLPEQQFCDDELLREAMLRAMETLAYRVMVSNKLYVSQDWMNETLVNIVSWINSIDKESRKKYYEPERYEVDLVIFLRQALSNVGLLRAIQHSRTDADYYFLDLSIQEWLAACHIARLRRKGIFYSRISSELLKTETEEEKTKAQETVREILRNYRSAPSFSRVVKLFTALLCEPSQALQKPSPVVTEQSQVSKKEQEPEKKRRGSKGKEPQWKSATKPTPKNEKLIAFQQILAKSYKLSEGFLFEEPVLVNEEKVSKPERTLRQDKGATGEKKTKKEKFTIALEEDYQRWLTTFDNFHPNSFSEDQAVLQNLFIDCQRSQTNSFRHILLLGGHGTGKTTLSRYIAAQWKPDDNSRTIPIVIRARWLTRMKELKEEEGKIIKEQKKETQSQQGNEILEQQDDEILEERDMISLSEVATVIRKLCLSSEDQKEFTVEDIETLLIDYKEHCFFLIDGYDLIAQQDTGKISGFLNYVLSQPRVIVTTRRSCQNQLIAKHQKLFDMRRKKAFVKTLAIVGFTHDKIKNYIRNYCKNICEKEDLAQSLSEKIWALLQASPLLLRTAHVPCILEIFCNNLAAKELEELSSIEDSTSLTVTLFENLIRVMTQRIRQSSKQCQDKILQKAMERAMELLAYRAMISHKICLQQSSLVSDSTNLKMRQALKSVATWITLQDNTCRTQNIEWLADYLYQKLLNVGFLKQMKQHGANKPNCYFLDLSVQQYFAARHLARKMGIFPREAPSEKKKNEAREILEKYKHDPSFKNVLIWCQALSLHQKAAQAKTTERFFFGAIRPESGRGRRVSRRLKRLGSFPGRRKKENKQQGNETQVKESKRRFSFRQRKGSQE